MCGINGFYSYQKLFSENDLQRMNSSLSHRGPDAGGLFFDGLCGLGNRRLKVIDLSDSANQPFYSQDGRYVMVYNGEVYNYAEVADQLKADTKNKVSFKTKSDTEVIIEAVSYYGLAFVEKLNGMFAIAVYDKAENELYLFRDRLGIKPLYYYWDGQHLAFASELKSLMLLPQLKLKINYAAVYDFLHLGYIPAPDSIYLSVHKLDAGNYLKLSKNNLSVVNYWNCESKLSANMLEDESEALMQLDELMLSSVKYQMKSDVPFGVFLSGGIDSSLVAALSASQSSAKVNTFSIGFQETAFNEAEHAKKVADYLGTTHHEFIVSYKDALPLVDKMIDVYDEPYADSSAIPTMLVSKMARQHVTVALSGDGGDELFFGYGAYKWAETLSNPALKLFHHPISSTLKLIPSGRYQRVAGLFDYTSYQKIRSHIFSQEQYLFSEDELCRLLGLMPGLGTLIDQDIQSEKRKLTDAEQQSIFDIKYYLKEDLLTKVDRASMLYSLETRVPYLDHRIVEFAINLSPELKNKNGETKYLLKKLLYQKIPKHFFERRKQGFSIPLSQWMKTELRHLIDKYLSKEIIERFGLVRYPVVEKLKKNFFSGKDYLYNRLWLLIVLHKWLDRNE
jgi:asparagine synthase (glutamine-hydrolysing)